MNEKIKFHLFSNSTASIMSADHQQAISEMDGMTNSIYNLPPRGHRRLDSDRSSVGSIPTLRRAAALRANSVVCKLSFTSFQNNNSVAIHLISLVAMFSLCGTSRSSKR